MEGDLPSSETDDIDRVAWEGDMSGGWSVGRWECESGGEAQERWNAAAQGSGAFSAASEDGISWSNGARCDFDKSCQVRQDRNARTTTSATMAV
jgi:hypothetical protein